MPHDAQPALGDLIGKRLLELVHAGWMTPQAWQSTVQHGPVTMGVITHYLNRCLQGPPHGSQTA